MIQAPLQMVTDKEIASCVESLLRQAGPAAGAPSVDAIVRQLEAKLGVDLSHKASFIRDQIQLLLGPAHHPQPLPQFHPYATAQPYSSLPGASPSPFAHLPHHHELAFRAPSPVVVHAANQHQQLMQHSHVGLPRPEGSVGALSPVALRPIAVNPKESSPAPAKRRGGPGGLSKVCGVSPELQAIVGEPTMARTQIVKQLWAYIRKNNLQDPNNKRKIICNNELRLVFETDCTDMFKMNKLLAKHIIPLEATKDQAPASKRAKTESSEVASETKPDVDQYAVVISDALATFFGTEEKEMLQSEALKCIWDYIKENQLEDPTNSMMVLCDSKLQQLFGCESLSASGISEMLAQHLIKQS
ncbi:upstream activation factor subunit UAF30 protein [Dioscorea alata]|uniref:Upstream activation factor subunit UAF30 protein n=1 Tax=Dioscorea alata TaxID=55571 RepID=A0ACB7VIS2_DIOAL|nr:upstream activation factor subunit UAF30 protein [Dioscorea alata]